MTWMPVEKMESAQGRKCVPVRWQPKRVEKAEIHRERGVRHYLLRGLGRMNGSTSFFLRGGGGRGLGWGAWGD